AVLVGATLVPVLWGPLGLVYLIAAIILGAAFLWLALVLRRQTTSRHASVLFHYSLLYLALLFVAMAIHPLLSCPNRCHRSRQLRRPLGGTSRSPPPCSGPRCCSPP